MKRISTVSPQITEWYKWILIFRIISIPILSDPTCASVTLLLQLLSTWGYRSQSKVPTLLFQITGLNFGVNVCIFLKTQQIFWKHQHLCFLFCFILLFPWNRKSLYSFGCPRTDFVDQVVLELTEILWLLAPEFWN